MKTINEVMTEVFPYQQGRPIDSDIAKMLEIYGNEVVDACVAIAMAVDITNTRAKIMDTKQNDVWRQVMTIKTMIK